MGHEMTSGLLRLEYNVADRGRPKFYREVKKLTVGKNRIKLHDSWGPSRMRPMGGVAKERFGIRWTSKLRLDSGGRGKKRRGDPVSTSENNGKGRKNGEAGKPCGGGGRRSGTQDSESGRKDHPQS